MSVFMPGAILPVVDGAQARAASLLDRLTHEFQSVAVYSHEAHPHHPWTEASRAAFRRRWPGIELVVEKPGLLLSLVTLLKRLAILAIPSAAVRVLSLSVPGATPRLDDLKARSAVWVINYHTSLFRMNGIDPRRSYIETHDLAFLKVSKIRRRSIISLRSLIRWREEAAVLAASRGLIAISPVERTIFRALISSERVFYVPSWTRAPPLPERGMTAERHDLLFVGSDYNMNARGLVEFLDQNRDWLSPYNIAVCGEVCRNPELRKRAEAAGNIRLMGYVDDIDQVYSESRAAISPVDGTGAKMKIVAALDAGVPVFASRNSMDGLPPGFENCIFDLDPQVMRGILASPSALRQGREAAVAYRQSWDESSDFDEAVRAIRGDIDLLPGAKEMPLHVAHRASVAKGAKADPVRS